MNDTKENQVIDKRESDVLDTESNCQFIGF